MIRITYPPEDVVYELVAPQVGTEADENQMRFLALVYTEERVKATLLNVPEDVRASIEAFPAMRWKAHKAANHVSRNAPPDPRLSWSATGAWGLRRETTPFSPEDSGFPAVRRRYYADTHG